MITETNKTNKMVSEVFERALDFYLINLYNLVVVMGDLMISDIVLKYSSILELSLYERFTRFAGEGHPCPIVVLTGIGVCALDVCIDTVKFPLVAIENVVFALINIGGACCFDECRLQDAYQNLKSAAFGVVVATPVAVVLAIPRFIRHLCVVLRDPQHAKPVHEFVERDSLSPAIITRTQEAPVLQG